MAMSSYPNLILKVTKWPTAVGALVLLPGVVIALSQLLGTLLSSPRPLGLFIAGFALYIILDRLLFRRQFMGSYFSTFEHELTHALFAWFTLHKVVGLRVTWREGGYVQILGDGNWLIAIAPYWFPTLCLPLMIASGFVTPEARVWVAVALGFFFAYHQVSTYRETHREQTDLLQTTWLFAALFLPTANLVMIGVMLSFARWGWGGVSSFLGSVIETTQGLF